MGPHLQVQISGAYACFSRPEFKVERVSYPVITPSAARGVLEAIFWKPEIRYEIRRIGVIKPGKQAVILRNEIEDRQGRTPIRIEEKRQQRSSLILKDVAYVIEADIVLRSHATDPLAKYYDQARRRIEKGQCFHTPYLGTREFAASFGPSNGQEPDASINFHVGTLLFDLAFIPSAARSDLTFKVPGQDQPASGYVQALFLEDAKISNGWLSINPELYQRLHQMERGHV